MLSGGLESSLNEGERYSLFCDVGDLLGDGVGSWNEADKM